MTKATKAHYEVLKHILRYLAGVVYWYQLVWWQEFSQEYLLLPCICALCCLFLAQLHVFDCCHVYFRRWAHWILCLCTRDSIQSETSCWTWVSAIRTDTVVRR
jgi:hypothetical protein